MNPLFPSIFWIILSMLTAVPLWMWRGRLSARQERIGSLCRWLLIPYMGLITGTLSPRLMGLTAIDWVVGLQNGVGLVLAVLVLLMLVRAAVSLPAVTQPSVQTDPLAEDPQFSQTAATALDPARWVHTIRMLPVAGAEEFHWCFLRAATQEAALVFASGASSPAYAAIWIATLLTIPEALLRVDTHPQRLTQLVALVATAVLFFFTRNFWLCWMLHAAILSVR